MRPNILNSIAPKQEYNWAGPRVLQLNNVYNGFFAWTQAYMQEEDIRQFALNQIDSFEK